MTLPTLTDPRRPVQPSPDHTTVDPDLLRFLVAEFKVCAETGVSVTMHEAVAIEAEDRSTGKRATKLLCAAAFEQTWLPRLAAMPFLPDITVTVHDGRELAGTQR